jgi:hypothetical protein
MSNILRAKAAMRERKRILLKENWKKKISKVN